jgi:hypothetical protein
MSKLSVEKLLRVPQSLRDSVTRTKVTYRNLGTSGLRISNPILGGLHLGMSSWFPWVLNEDQVRPLFIPILDCFGCWNVD